MQELLTLTKLLNKVEPINKFNSGAKTKNSILYSAILKNQINNDNDALNLIFNSNVRNNQYNVFKSRYYDQLITSLQKLNPNELSLVPRAINKLEVLDGLKIYNILDSGFKVRDKLIFLKKLLKKSQKIEDISLMMIVTFDLYNVYSVWVQNKKLEKYYWNLLVKYQNYFNEKILTTRIFSYYANLILSKKNLNKTKIDLSIKSTLFELQKSKNVDYYTKHQLFSSLYYHHLIGGNIEEIKECCKSALAYFDSRKNNIAGGYYSFLIKYAFVLMFEKYYQESYSVLEVTPIRKIPRNSIISLNINLYAIKNLIYLSNYKEATLRLLDVTRHKDYEKIKTPFFTEIYKIKEAYLNVLYKMKKFKLDDDSLMRKKPFRINKFLNEVPVYSKDKQGSNISILIIHIFYLFINKKYDLILNRLESLKAYSHRYLRNDDSLRSNAFIKILLQLPGSNYHPIAFERYSAKYYDKMINAPLHLAARHIEVEVIPYEKQYEILTDLLQMRLEQKI